MKANGDIKFKVIINGKKSGAFGQWQDIQLIVNSSFGEGSDDEKFSVLSAVRKTYDQKNNTDIRGTEGQSPAQIGRCEGFRELSYHRISTASPLVVIVPPAIQHLRLVPRPIFKEEINLMASASH